MDEKMIESLWRILQHYGPRPQIIKAIEELAELQTELARDLNGQGNPDNMLSESADAFIMLMQVMAIYNIDMEALDEEIRFKIDRQLRRIEEEES